MVDETTPTLRAPDGKWLKGAPSPNPSGRPKVLGEVMALARGHTAEAIETLVTVMTDEEQPAAARVAAANSILDRGYGKPPAAVAHFGLGDTGFAEVSTAVLLATLGEALRAVGISADDVRCMGVEDAIDLEVVEVG